MGKRIIAIIGVILLVLLYGSTIVFALMGNENFFTYLIASLMATILIPIILYLYTLMDKYRRKKGQKFIDIDTDSEDK